MMESKILALIVDDEQEAIDYLSILLKENCPEIEVIATANTSADALKMIYRQHPDLIFMDIKIDDKDGFDIVEEMNRENHSAHIIFVTAYDHYAIDAFKANAIDYLLKPVDKDELVIAVHKFLDQNNEKTQFLNLQNLIRNKTFKISFNTRTGYILINPQDIVYCQSEGNYSEIFLSDNSKKLVTYNLGNLFKQLPDSFFKRISRFNIINENFLIEVDKRKHICILKYNGHKISLGYSSKIFFK